MNIVRTPFYLAYKLLFRLIMPLIKKIVEHKKARDRITVWIIHDLMKQIAVTGRNEVKLYPYMHIS
jgi:hypothetical protein